MQKRLAMAVWQQWPSKSLCYWQLFILSQVWSELRNAMLTPRSLFVNAGGNRCIVWSVILPALVVVSKKRYWFIYARLVREVLPFEILCETVPLKNASAQ